MTKTNVLIFPAGEINSVELHDSLSTCVNIEVFGASSIDRHGEYIFKNYISNVPLISEPNFINEFNKILIDKKIDFIFPTHDTVAVFLVENQDKLNAKVISADLNTTLICRDKEKTYTTLKEFDFIPKTFRQIEQYPVFIKPKTSQGGVGAKLINSKKDFPQDIDLNEYVICEYLPNEEFTVDCFTDKNKELKVISPRFRNRLMAGVCVNGTTEELTDEIKTIAKNINSKLNFRGLWWFQIKKDNNGKFKLLEISTRCAGTMGLTRAKGYNLPLLSVYDALGYDINVKANEPKITMDRTLISRYKLDYEYNTVYIDFDDTIIIKNKVHIPAISFLYQCKNECKKIILITKHEQEIYETLKDYRIDKNLFDEIIHVSLNDKKSKYITCNKTIFIDNSFKEREEVANDCKIPVFDVDNLEVLLNWRL